VLSIGRINPALIGIALDPKDGSILRDEAPLAFFVGGVSTRGDIERGYVESTATYRVRSNDRRGFLLLVRPRTARAESVELEGVAQPVALGANGVELHRPWRAGAQQILLRIRVRLDELVRPGRMELPVQVTFAAL